MAGQPGARAGGPRSGTRCGWLRYSAPLGTRPTQQTTSRAGRASVVRESLALAHASEHGKPRHPPGESERTLRLSGPPTRRIRPGTRSTWPSRWVGQGSSAGPASRTWTYMPRAWLHRSSAAPGFPTIPQRLGLTRWSPAQTSRTPKARAGS